MISLSKRTVLRDTAAAVGVGLLVAGASFAVETPLTWSILTGGAALACLSVGAACVRFAARN